MSKKTAVVACFLAAALYLLAWYLTPSRAAGPPAAPAVRWHRSYAEARRVAEASGRPIFIDLRCTPCVWCDKLERETLGHPAIAQVLARCVCVRLDAGDGEAAEDAANLAEALGLKGYPQSILAAPDGTGPRALTGFADVGSLLRWLQGR